jgi:peptidoglycan/xylan/chitin deacetylase (PgdA/CDA1 family)
MSLRDAWSMAHAGRWLKRRFARRALILMYHRVTELANDPYLLAVTPDHFAQHMELIRRYALPMRLGQLLQAVATGSVPHRAVVITLDDGYADNAHEAKPILERFEIPATVFVVAGQVGAASEFWWDELDRLLLQRGSLPPALRLQLNGTVEEWQLGQASRYSETDYRHHRTWHVERQDDPTPRHRLFRALFDRLYRSTDADKQQILRQVRTWAEADRVGRPTHRALTRSETVLLSQGGLVEIGAHTMSHPALTALLPAEQRDEIQRSKDCLEEMLEQPVVSFAYPHGASSQATAGIVSDAGFQWACCSHADALFRGTDRFQLPRLGIRDWDRDAFARWLRWWIGH